MAGRGNRDDLSLFLEDTSWDEFLESADLMSEDDLPTQEPITLGLVEFCLKYGPKVIKDYKLDEVTTLLLESIEHALVTGEPLMAVPYSRCGKSTALHAAMVWSVMRWPEGNPQILISASTRLAQNHSKKILEWFRAAGGTLHPKSKSTMEWRPFWKHGAEVAVLGRSSSCLGRGSWKGLWLDDVAPSRKDTFSATVMDDIWERFTSDWVTRMEGKKPSLVVINQRLSSSDFASQIITASLRAKKSRPWNLVHIPLLHQDMEERAKIIASYPPNWSIKMLAPGEPGAPTNSRWTQEQVEEKRAMLSPAAFEAMMQGDVSGDSDMCPFKDHYLREIAPGELQPGSCVLGIDAAITGQGDGHGYAVVASGLYECKGKAIIVEAGELKGAVDQLIPQVVELVKKYRVSTVAVEQAGGGHFLFKELNLSLSGFGVNVEFVSHRGRSKFSRMEEALPAMSMGKVLVPTNAVWLTSLRTQLKAIATRQERARDDIADACLYSLEVVMRWIRGGFQQTTAEWGRAGFTPKAGGNAIWSRGTSAGGPSMEGQFQLPVDRPFPGKNAWDR